MDIITAWGLIVAAFFAGAALAKISDLRRFDQLAWRITTLTQELSSTQESYRKLKADVKKLWDSALHG